MLKVAIIGLGTISHVHLYAIENTPNVQLTCVCDVDSSKKSSFKKTPFYTDVDKMLQSEKLDCVHICLPHHLHVKIALKCAKYGVNVFLEKPVALNFNEAQELFEAEKTYNVKIGVCFQNRYNNTSLELKRLIAENNCGKFLGAKAIVTWCRPLNYYKSAPWRGKFELSGGGVMINQAIHTLDLLSYIAGEFKCLEANVANFSLKQTDIEDSVMARLTYKNGANAVFFATVSHCDNSPVELSFLFKNVTFQIIEGKLFRLLKGSSDKELICADEKLENAKSYYGPNHLKAVSAFYTAIQHSTSCYISAKDASYSLKIIDSIGLSSKLGTAVEIL